MTGWPAFHGLPPRDNATNTSNVCTPGGTEVVCASCGAHLGDYFDDEDVCVCDSMSGLVRREEGQGGKGVHVSFSSSSSPFAFCCTLSRLSLCACQHFCIDGVCLMPPGSNRPCPPGPSTAPSKEAAWGAFRKLIQKAGAKSTREYIEAIEHAH